MSDLDRVLLLKKYAPELADRLAFVPDPTEVTLTQIQCGILFVIAFWSGPAIQVLRKLSSTVARLDPMGRLEFVIIDTDDIDQNHSLSQLFDFRAGYGERMWVHQGVVVAQSARGTDFECIESNTTMLLELCND